MTSADTYRQLRQRKRWQGLLQVAFLVGGTFSVVYFCLLTAETDTNPHFRSRTILQDTSLDLEILPYTGANVTTTTIGGPLFPRDLFTLYQRRQGAIVCHILGMIYMFIALAIVCDEFFVPALHVIIEKLQISENVAGATIMAAALSAPELFTAIIGVFISFDDIGIGTIVGSAVFNILFVIAMCILFSRTVLDLTWWPIFRDITFYSIALIMLVIFFMDSYIYWYEALLMFSIYLAYCGFMKVNETFKKHLNKNKASQVGSTDQLVLKHSALNTIPAQGDHPEKRSSALISATKIRRGILQGKEYDSGTQLQEIVSKTIGGCDNIYCSDTLPNTGSQGIELDLNEEDDETKPIDLSWPDTTLKRITYVVVAPIIFPLWITLPDTRSPSGKQFYLVTFIGSILWIAIFSYLMVWWATVVGQTVRIPPEVMGLTILAAGTSVPRLITSVIVARKGFGDMAVSFSIGINIFDVCCGLPIPWLLYSLVQLIMNFVRNKENPWNVEPILVSTGGMACSIMLLFTMIMFVLISIICSRWKMTKCLGVFMVVLYFMFVAISLSFEYQIIRCPI